MFLDGVSDLNVSKYSEAFICQQGYQDGHDRVERTLGLDDCKTLLPLPWAVKKEMYASMTSLSVFP